ncbi:carbohydrate ABC transporter permease [Cohnella thailandensis]|uniref:Sugar ABC transporter permease n=1 Tax=Cohnella thailandensis TaxID=557557 RepID=A0A841T4T4_9BACL|nr:sugar ABC transporter permease [Cohnella thailandensis]MBB6636141.1 sugar ABC transporter permease [Cohnella thailandensis]MBP1973890.1 ABC-type sugar transport system permease subunit [Cohnella thailandensis]
MQANQQARTSTGMLGRRRWGPLAWPYLFALPFVLAYAAFQLYPVVYSFILSLHDWNGIGAKTYIGFRNYEDLLTRDPLFFKSLSNTLIMMLMSIPATLIVGVLLAYWTFQLNKGRKLFQTVNFLPYITTPVAIGFIFSYLFDWQTGLINLVLLKFGWLTEGIYWLQGEWTSRMIIALMVVWRNLGYFMVIYIAGMTAIPQDVYEAAKIDGSTGFHTFTRITMPLLRNITVFLVVTSVINGLQLFDEPKLLYGGWSGSAQVGGPDNTALTVIWKFVDDSFISNTRFGYSSAIAYSLFVLIVLFSIISYKITAPKEDGR